MKTTKALMVTVRFGILLATVTAATGQTWIPIATNQNWTCIASSADGARIVVGSQFQPICLSTNSGATWAAVNTPSNLWASVASSADGSVLVALAQQWQDGLIYRSTNSGADWIPTSAPGTPNLQWNSVACSADGHEVVATTAASGIYRSLDWGATWSVTSAPDTNYWRSIACSADGTKMVAASENYVVPPYYSVSGGIYVSSDSGATWTEASGTGGQNWYSVACSADGTKMMAAGSAVYVSTNSGVGWTPVVVPLEYPWPVASSSDGTRLAAAGYPGLIYFSGDSGADWVATSAGSNYWEYITCSADGNAWLALDVGHGIVWRLQIPPNPQLAITPRSGSLALSWPLPSMNFVLQQCSDLITPDWFNATGTPVLNLTNLQNEIVLSPTNGTGFYRLAAP